MSQIAVVVPCYKVTHHVASVIARIPNSVATIYAIDDACPDNSGEFIEKISDPRVVVLYLRKNLGVGGAVKAGYKRAFEDGHDIVVKIDGDGQMDPQLLDFFTQPILDGLSDYTKGNRFYDPRTVSAMPKSRLIGNAGLSFLTKLSSGYWSMFDPTNGYTAIHRIAYERLDMDLVDDRFFFETDTLSRLNIVRAVIMDVPMNAVYKDEVSNLSIKQEFSRFFRKNMSLFFKRLVYSYFVRGFSLASVNLLVGIILMLFGILLGATIWINSLATGVSTTAGGAALVVVLLVVGNQMLQSFLAFDFSSEPTIPLSRLYQHGTLSFMMNTEVDANDSVSTDDKFDN